MIKEKNVICCGCEACANACPQKCISMEKYKNFYYPMINHDLCVNCNICEKVCPLSKNNNEQYNKISYAGYLNSDIERMKSTSGGVFYALANFFIKNNGIVYGAIFDDDYNVIHSRASTIDEVKKMQGSKYPQSRIGNTFLDIKKDLDSGKNVLFSGTPCQINGLSSYLGRKYEKLFLVDIICHGVASPVIWKMYLDNLCYGEKINKIVFKDKKNGWKNWNVLIETNKTVYRYEKLKNSFMSSYLCGYNVRSSCFNCEFKGNNRFSDITIGDGWGIPEKEEELNDGKGLSSIIINTSKGKQLFEMIESQMKLKQYSLNDLTIGNKAYYDCIYPNKFRDKFMRDIEVKGIQYTLKKFSIFSFRGKLYYKISEHTKRRK